ncbi:AraC family transcriptional regulator [Rubellicoccus peritrichatus]|uniref:AraC family transcriptional regulator n=1 Tax=Rubellicoccus peritrichatus TaxID=3080537 RepID=A0AAQ3LGZ5_9BACT|nr:AraC family transcriptional regulator [Puniceicoccus sp. CR14]WOO41974.1 AraC family transcriptional regulator [Puniceicoccus sp. CR14]
MDEVVYRDDSVLGLRSNTNLQLVYVFEGAVEVDCWSGEHLLQAGDAILLLPGEQELFRFSAGTYHGWCEVVMAELPHETIEAYRKLNWPDRFPERLRSLHTIAMGVMDRSVFASGALLASIAQAVFHSFFREMGLTPTHNRPLPPAVAKAKVMIEERFADNIKLREIAQHAGISAQHLGRMFRLHLKSTPNAWLWDCRVKEGIRLLESTGLSVTEIAYRTGFQNPYHFSRLIKQRLGVPPNRYRNQLWRATSESKNAPPEVL